MQQEIPEFLKNKDPKLCVIATASKSGKPECAVMGYTVLDDLTIILSTDNASRKWQNLQENPQVALTFGWSFEELNVQYDAVAKLITEGNALQECEAAYFANHPEAAEFKGLPETAYIKVIPYWLRLSDYTVEPPRIEEVKLREPLGKQQP